MFFVPQVGEITTDLGKHQHMHDRDDLQAEQVICYIFIIFSLKTIQTLSLKREALFHRSPVSDFPVIVSRLKQKQSLSDRCFTEGMDML